MVYVIYLIVKVVRLLLYVLELAMLLRAILSWLPIDEDSTLVNFLYAITEPLISPVRLLLDKLGWFRHTPLDISFFITFLLISLLATLL